MMDGPNETRCAAVVLRGGAWTRCPNQTDIAFFIVENPDRPTPERRRIYMCPDCIASISWGGARETGKP